MDNVIYIKPSYNRPLSNAIEGLKPCPFCGGVAELDQDMDTLFYIACINTRCHINPITIGVASERQARKVWNYRYTL